MDIMKVNKSNSDIKIQRLIDKTKQDDLAEKLLQTAEAGFEKGSPWKKAHFYHTLEAVNSVIFTATAGLEDKIVGLLIASISAGESDIYMIVVDKEYKQNRIGYQLFKHLIEHCRQEEVESIFLEVRVSNKPAIGLYESLGFERLNVRKAYYSSPIEDAIVMLLKIEEETD